MFTSDTRTINRDCKVTFAIELREEEEDPVRHKRGLDKQKALPSSITVEEAPFSFTLTHSPRLGEGLLIAFTIVRSEITGEQSLDVEQTISTVYYAREGDEVGVELNEAPGDSWILQPNSGSDVTFQIESSWSEIMKLWGTEEPKQLDVHLTFSMETAYDLPVVATSERSTLHPLEALPSFVESSRPNNVRFILASSPSRPLYSTKSVLVAASTYFRDAFFPSPHLRRSSGGGHKSIAFADDSDASDEDDLEILPAPEVIGSQRTKRKSPELSAEMVKDDSEEEEQKKTGESKRKKKVVVANKAHSSSDGEEEEEEMGEIHIDDGAYSTMKAILVYLLTGKIQFAPLSTQGRDAYLRGYRKRYPERPTPVSPRSTYRLACRFEMPDLQMLALAQLKFSFTTETAVQEALVDDCYHFPAYRSLVHDLIVKDWKQVSRSQTWKDVLKKAEKGHFPRSGTLLPMLLQKAAGIEE